MKNNPLIPYVLIMAFGIGLIFFMSLEGAKQRGTSLKAVKLLKTADDGEALVQASCIGCHGGDLTGGMGPDLIGLDAEHIKDVLINGSR